MTKVTKLTTWHVVTHMHSSSDSSACSTTPDQSGPAGMSSAQAPFPEPVYATPKEPRELTGEDLAFISKYTGRPQETLRRHILDVWDSAKKQVDSAHFAVLSSGRRSLYRRCGMPSCSRNSAVTDSLRFSPCFTFVHRHLCTCASKNSAFLTLG